MLSVSLECRFEIEIFFNFTFNYCNNNLYFTLECGLMDTLLILPFQLSMNMLKRVGSY